MKAWHQFLLDQEAKIGKESVEKWLKSLQILSYDARNLYLQADNPFQLSWIKQNYPTFSLKNENGFPIKVYLSMQGSLKKEKPSLLQEIPQRIFSPSTLCSEARFSKLLEVKENQEGYRLVKALTEKKDFISQFNPILLYGPSGSGKSSLLMAAAFALQEIGLKVFYAKAETFTEHVVWAIRQGQMQNFRNTYRNIDLLIVDDVHLFSSKNATQEEFFHTFNALYSAKKQILLSANAAPLALELEPRLISRLEWGVSIGLRRPEKESLHALIEQKEIALNIELSEKAKEYLLQHWQGSFKSLTQAMEILAIKSEERRIEIDKTIYLLKEFLGSTFLDSNRIIKKVAEHFGLSSLDLLGRSQKKEVSFPRQFAMYLCRKLLELPLQQIGKNFNRDHSTVISGISQIEALAKEQNPSFIRTLSALQARIENSKS